MPASDHHVLGSASRRALFAEGVLSAASESGVAFIPLYLVLLGATDREVGLLAVATGSAALDRKSTRLNSSHT